MKMGKPNKKTKTPVSHDSEIAIDVTRRGISEKTRLQLYVVSGGRCEFDGCNEYLLEHHITLRTGNYGQAAHIIAFRSRGPRGRSGRQAQINAVENLMLLCPKCHKEIDDRPDHFTKSILEEYKKCHEARIRHVTSLAPERKTAILILKAPVNGQAVTIPFDDIVAATVPRYPSNRHPTIIDLTAISDKGDAFIQASCNTIKDSVKQFFASNGEGRLSEHVSIFALAPIPLLIYLGRQLTNKIPTDLYQRHRDTEMWTWKTGETTAKYTVKKINEGNDESSVALILSLSGPIKVSNLPDTVKQSATIYSITLDGKAPCPACMRTRQDLEAFRIAFQEALALIGHNHGLLKSIDLFPAVPAPVAVLCGRELLPKVHPSLRVWDYDKTKGGFTFQLEVK